MIQFCLCCPIHGCTCDIKWVLLLPFAECLLRSAISWRLLAQKCQVKWPPQFPSREHSSLQWVLNRNEHWWCWLLKMVWAYCSLNSEHWHYSQWYNCNEHTAADRTKTCRKTSFFLNDWFGVGDGGGGFNKADNYEPHSKSILHQNWWRQTCFSSCAHSCVHSGHGRWWSLAPSSQTVSSYAGRRSCPDAAAEHSHPVTYTQSVTVHPGQATPTHLTLATAIGL